ncbi:hypothetical protein LTR36_009803 [Oleoguttula mirabilis]|uniref:SprT-like domain-containing protein n=1 Tax=Oleoguttula mirabilis TaxID=1507867 RepID=A0AAV9J5C8_9PEZI|nr:hypothetical protein LTR36_009803 [Oleoguttula mirabilis]
MEVVHKALRYFDRPTYLWTPMQHKAVHALRRWLDIWKGPDAGEKPMRQVIGLISKIFFLGKLKRCKFRWDEGLVHPSPAVGITDLLAKGVVSIRMDPSDYHEADETDDVVTSHIGTLLHECAHAFIKLYTCGLLCDHAVCKQSHAKIEGHTGHAQAWLLLACRLERTARIVLGLDVRLGICQSLRLEFLDTRYVPSSEVWWQMTDVYVGEIDRYLADVYHLQSIPALGPERTHIRPAVVQLTHEEDAAQLPSDMAR